MSKIRLHGSSSGYTEIAPVAASSNNTITLPDSGLSSVMMVTVLSVLLQSQLEMGSRLVMAVSPVPHYMVLVQI